MASSSQQPTPPRSSPVSKTDKKHDDEMPSANELMKIASKSLQTGAVTGGIGLVIGAGSGIVRSAPPALFALVAGLQWFALGSSYMASRSLLWHAWGGEENLTPSDYVKASGVAGGVSGMVGGMFRGPRNIIPGILFFGTVGATGQYVSQRFKSKSQDDSKSSWLDSKWVPLKRLTDREYEEKLEEKILRIDAEISIIDENIASLRANSESAKSDEKNETLRKS
ncbi:hypothetical protein F5Y04DRAFT_89772 [Hypomontagnella monticulosa]|nr:hypothetical protein F5Y04DRAFT_89772 [Hypomontagnella monticulosa]